MLLIGVAISIFSPENRIWPPPRKDSWQFWVSWILFDVGMIGSGLIGFVDFNILGYGFWIHILVGGLAIIIGSGIALWGVRTLSMYQSFGLKGKLVTEGPYQYLRNPQYLGFILMYTGVILVTYSFMALVTGLVMIVIFFILPFSEEPWLKQQYGEAYVKYCRQVPRFFSLRSFRSKNTIGRN
ncbi:MAG: isoprenylcysteine carboxylmethyltransferase family protein [Candidatus Bathyarchaeota archaeon]